MVQRSVLITINRPPYGSIYYTEGLRAAVGVTSGIDENIVTVVYLGDGSYFTLKGVDRKDTDKYLSTLKKQGTRLIVQKESLQERGIKESEIETDFEILPTKEILDLMQRVDFTMDF
ncbi:MAG TPA: DsrE family protein [Candidatus Hypogeohydataceae bacterium YC41]